MNAPLMPKATAVWLVDNTALSFEQIADFCGLHALEVQAIADDEVAIGMQGQDPIANGQVLREERQSYKTMQYLKGRNSWPDVRNTIERSTSIIVHERGPCVP